jgi:hypothetical protein
MKHTYTKERKLIKESRPSHGVILFPQQLMKIMVMFLVLKSFKLISLWQA